MTKKDKRLDSVINVRLSATELATALRYWQGQGAFPRSRGELIRETFNLAVRVLVGNQEVERVTSTDQALEILSFFSTGFNPGGKAARNLKLNLADESGRDFEAELKGLEEKL